MPRPLWVAKIGRLEDVNTSPSLDFPTAFPVDGEWAPVYIGQRRKPNGQRTKPLVGIHTLVGRSDHFPMGRAKNDVAVSNTPPAIIMTGVHQGKGLFCQGKLILIRGPNSCDQFQ